LAILWLISAANQVASLPAMPSPSSNAAQILLLAPADLPVDVADEDLAAPAPLALAAAPKPLLPAAASLLISLLLHGLVGVLFWQWIADYEPEPPAPTFQVRLQTGGATPAPVTELPPAPKPAAASAPARPLRTPPAPAPRELAKTATTTPALPAPVIAENPAPVAAAAPAVAPAELPGVAVASEIDIEVSSATVRVLEWLAQHRRYPAPARRARLQGVVEVVVVLMPDGRLVDQRVAQSSGHAILDKAALELLRRASPVPASAFGGGEARQLELRLPIVYRLSI
jgi:periplasmic protein TonB